MAPMQRRDGAVSRLGPVTPVLRYECCDCEPSPGYRVRPCFKENIGDREGGWRGGKRMGQGRMKGRKLAKYLKMQNW